MAYGGPVPETPVSPAETRIYIAFGPALRERWSIPEGKSCKTPLVQAARFPPFLASVTSQRSNVTSQSTSIYPDTALYSD